ncbi:phage shock protein A [Hahella sp. CCB-MM4]|uniref:PspA/IM30 family protein n=1 Tax=Hahella sp. (strain CCB-MM4) TaxID=1926491 RepID=UPI000B9C613C|nr:PspA/IM30 family protein [Hahella sp. CCB-MM4]OZG71797.1 phage shock protein A [Hahella sp. CCB-MM4]
MNVWAKMMTALRGGVNEAGEAIVDSQALRILDQEVRDASEELKQSKESLVAIIAQQKVAEEKCSKLKEQIGEYEGYAVQALNKEDETLALEIAEKIATFENQLQTEEDSAAGFKENADKLRASIQQAEGNIKRLKQQVDTVKATESVQRAQKAVAARYAGSNSKLRTAMDSLERIKEKQTHTAAKMSAAEELSKETTEDDLKTKLEKAGIVSNPHSANDVLARLKQKSSK